MQKRNAELVRNLTPDFIRRGDPNIISNISNANIAGLVPTDAELDSAFDTPANLPEGFTALVNDNGAVTAVWLVTALDGAWFYIAMTKAV